MTIPPGYKPLRDALNAALAQAACGKGHERHADGGPFLTQPLMTTTQQVGVGFPLGQAMKKTTEASGMLTRKQKPQARAELLGAIIYLAAAYIYLGDAE